MYYIPMYARKSPFLLAYKHRAGISSRVAPLLLDFRPHLTTYSTSSNDLSQNFF